MTKPSSLALALFATFVPVAGALAAPATPEEADRLKAVFERYLGHPAPGAPSSVTVTPEGSAYRASFDLQAMARPLENLGVSFDPATETLLLTPNDDGTWKVSSDALPPMTIHVKDQTNVVRWSSYALQATFDPKLGAFTTATWRQDGVTSDQDAPTVSQHQRFGHLASDLKGAPAEADTASIDMHSTAGDVSNEMTIRQAAPKASVAVTPTPPPVAFSYTMPAAALDLSATKLRTKHLLDLWAFLVAHPGRDALAAAQDDLRSQLRAALPLLAGLKESGSADDFALTTQLGAFSAHKMAGSLALDGLAGAGSMAFTLSLDGLKVPSQDLPVWTVGFLPTAFDLKPTLTGFHFDEMMREAVNDFDLKTSEPFTPEQDQTLGHIIWPGDGKLTLAPSRITTGLLDIKLEGEGTLGSEPTGKLTVSAAGLDKAIAALQQATASDPSAQQVLAQFILAKNLAKPGPDGSSVWELEAGAAGAVTVNGTPLQ
ncbi:MAG TPA: hypothetical protein VH414_14170 [Lichenihabitans sp.]|jgi:hypothetical protein|nr:hypothetical protein [Lichenihabitans sp.]